MTSMVAAPLAAPPGYGRAYGTTTVLVSARGVMLPGARAFWRPLVPGTDDQYTGPLFGSPFDAVPLSFPQQADQRGTVQVWAPEPVRIEVVAWMTGFQPVRQILDLLFTEDTQAEADLAAHVVAQNAHPLSADAGNVIEWRPNGLFVPAGAVPPEYVTDAELDAALLDYYTQAEADARYQPVGDYATAAALAAAEARIATLESLVATLQEQMVTHIHAAGDWDYLGGASVPDGTP